MKPEVGIKSCLNGRSVNIFARNLVPICQNMCWGSLSITHNFVTLSLLILDTELCPIEGKVFLSTSNDFTKSPFNARS